MRLRNELSSLAEVSLLYIQSVRTIKTEQENYMDVVEGETGSYSETGVTCDVEGPEVVRQL